MFEMSAEPLPWRGQILGELFVVAYEFIETRDWLFEPSGTSGEALLPCSEEVAIAALAAAGWDGEGRLDFIWVPQFAIPGGDTHGTLFWHSIGGGGTSWLLADKPYALPGCIRGDGRLGWRRVQLTNRGWVFSGFVDPSPRIA
jgi:hypothetical protein